MSQSVKFPEAPVYTSATYMLIWRHINTHTYTCALRVSRFLYLYYTHHHPGCCNCNSSTLESCDTCRSSLLISRRCMPRLHFFSSYKCTWQRNVARYIEFLEEGYCIFFCDEQCAVKKKRYISEVKLLHKKCNLIFFCEKVQIANSHSIFSKTVNTTVFSFWLSTIKDIKKKEIQIKSINQVRIEISNFTRLLRIVFVNRFRRNHFLNLTLQHTHCE